MLMTFRRILAASFAFLLFAGPSLASGLEKYQFLKIAPQDHKAVMKTPGGELKLVGEGDVIAENATVVEIAEGRIVLEQVAGAGLETVIVRLDGKHQRIERVRKRGEIVPMSGLSPRSK